MRLDAQTAALLGCSEAAGGMGSLCRPPLSKLCPAHSLPLQDSQISTEGQR